MSNIPPEDDKIADGCTTALAIFVLALMFVFALVALTTFVGCTSCAISKMIELMRC